MPLLFSRASTIIFEAMNMKYTYPKGEIVWVSHYDIDHSLRYITTSKPSRDFYFLYELKEGKFVKLGKNIDPKVLEDKYIKL